MLSTLISAGAELQICEGFPTFPPFEEIVRVISNSLISREDHPVLPMVWGLSSRFSPSKSSLHVMS